MVAMSARRLASTGSDGDDTASRRRARSVPATAVLVIALLAVLAGRSAGQTFDAVREFKSWFKEYRKGGIDLYQKSPVPVASPGSSGLRYFRNDAIRNMDGLLRALADRNDLESAKLLTEAATFRFDRRGDVEVRKYHEKQPWILRTHAARCS